MVTINISDATKDKFKKLKLDVASHKGESVTEDELLVLLIDNFNEVNKKWVLVAGD